jgi:hypothetical protein
MRATRTLLGHIWPCRGWSARAQQRRIERPEPDWVEGRQIGAPRDAVGDQLCQGFAGRRCVEDAPDVMPGIAPVAGTARRLRRNCNSLTF